MIRVKESAQNFVLENSDVEAARYLLGHSFQEILLAEQTATALSLFKQGRPNATLTIDRVDPYSLGQLFLFFEFALIYLAEMLGVNAFDQPGVEESKQFIYALLGRKGFELQHQEILQLQQVAKQ